MKRLRLMEIAMCVPMAFPIVLVIHTVLKVFHLSDWKYTWGGALLGAFVLNAMARRVERALGRAVAGTMPPLNAEYLFYLFLGAEDCDAIVGDLEERFRIIHRKFGARRASFWYWTMAVRSVGPIAWAWVKKVVMKPVIGVIAWAVAKGIVGHDSWLAALVELYRRIRS